MDDTPAAHMCMAYEINVYIFIYIYKYMHSSFNKRKQHNLQPCNIYHIHLPSSSPNKRRPLRNAFIMSQCLKIYMLKFLLQPPEV